MGNIYLTINQIFLSDCHRPNFAPHKMKSQLEKEQKHGCYIQFSPCFKNIFLHKF